MTGPRCKKYIRRYASRERSAGSPPSIHSLPPAAICRCQRVHDGPCRSAGSTLHSKCYGTGAETGMHWRPGRWGSDDGNGATAEEKGPWGRGLADESARPADCRTAASAHASRCKCTWQPTGRGNRGGLGAPARLELAQPSNRPSWPPLLAPSRGWSPHHAGGPLFSNSLVYISNCCSYQTTASTPHPNASPNAAPNGQRTMVRVGSKHFSTSSHLTKQSVSKKYPVLVGRSLPAWLALLGQ